MVTKTNTIELPELIDFGKYSGYRLLNLCNILIKETPKRREETTDSIECRQSVSDDYKNTYLGIVNLVHNGKRGRFKLFLEEHYFFGPTISFKKVGKGGIGFSPYYGRIQMDQVLVEK